MEEQICPICGESNPVESGMCWACYTPLGVGQSGPIEIPRDERSIAARVADALPYLLLGAFTSSGWLGRRARLPVLGASLATVAGLLIEQKWRERGASALESPCEEEDPPMVRIAQTIFLYAFQENAAAIQLRNHGRGVDVDCAIEGQWRLQMKIPLYSWNSLRHVLLGYARTGEVRLRSQSDLGIEAPTFKFTALRAHLKTDAQSETLHLTFETAPLTAGENQSWSDAELPDVECQKCHEPNSPGAVWCWNCYASIEAPPASFVREKASEVALVAAVGALASSGWWPRRALPFVLGAGALGGLATFVAQFQDFCWNGKKIGRDKTRDPQIMVEPPVFRIAGSILIEALHERLENRVTKIRLQEHGNLSVFYQTQSEWRDGPMLPPYVWPALRQRLLQLAREGFTLYSESK